MPNPASQPTPPQEAAMLTPKTSQARLNCELYCRLGCPHKKAFPEDNNYPNSQYSNDGCWKPKQTPSTTAPIAQLEDY
jgi:hypothetical protein